MSDEFNFVTKENKMKRLLVLSIVLAMATVALADSVELRIGDVLYDGQDVMPSDWVSVVLVGGATTYPIAYGSYVNSTLGDQWSASYPTPATMGGWTFIAAGDGFTSSGSLNWIPPKATDNGDVLGVTFHIPDGTLPSTEFVVDWNVIYNSVAYQGSQVLHVVPEPATIALLGIGALSLLRRRRKTA
jgi:hypothetical protein